MRRLLMMLILILVFASGVAAETRYVTDQVMVSLRPAQDDRSTPIERLSTGMRVELLADMGAFLKVKSAAGNVGFVRAQYLVPTPPRSGGGSAELREALAGEQKKTAELAAELEKLKSAAPAAGTPEELDKLKAELADVTNRYKALQLNTDDLEGTIRERDQLKKDVARLTEENGALRARPAGQSGSALQWFFAGAAVFFVGWIAGKASRQKRRF